MRSIDLLNAEHITFILDLYRSFFVDDPNEDGPESYNGQSRAAVFNMIKKLKDGTPSVTLEQEYGEALVENRRFTLQIEYAEEIATLRQELEKERKKNAEIIENLQRQVRHLTDVLEFDPKNIEGRY